MFIITCSSPVSLHSLIMPPHSLIMPLHSLITPPHYSDHTSSFLGHYWSLFVSLCLFKEVHFSATPCTSAIFLILVCWNVAYLKSSLRSRESVCVEWHTPKTCNGTWRRIPLVRITCNCYYNMISVDTVTFLEIQA